MTHHYFPGRRQALAGLLAVAGFISPHLAGAAGTPTDAPRVEAAEVKALALRGEAVIVDVRGKQYYDFEHAEGAISIPIEQFEARVSELPKEKLIAAYCT